MPTKRLSTHSWTCYLVLQSRHCGWFTENRLRLWPIWSRCQFWRDCWRPDCGWNMLIIEWWGLLNQVPIFPLNSRTIKTYMGDCWTFDSHEPLASTLMPVSGQTIFVTLFWTMTFFLWDCNLLRAVALYFYFHTTSERSLEVSKTRNKTIKLQIICCSLCEWRGLTPWEWISAPMILQGALDEASQWTSGVVTCTRPEKQPAVKICAAVAGLPWLLSLRWDCVR